MLKENLSLLQTLNEALPPKQAMIAHALITARFAVVPKAGKTADGLPILALSQSSEGKVALFVSMNAPAPDEDIPDSPLLEDI